MAEALYINNFSGGMTDYYLDAGANRYRKADNFLLVKHEQGVAKLFTRYGSEVWDATNYQIPAGNQRIGALKLFQGSTTSKLLLVQSAHRLYYVSAGAWVTCTGPSGNQVYPNTVTTSNVWKFDEWSGHLLTCVDSYQKPQKIYFDNTSTLRVRTAGMPDLASAPVITPAGNTGQSFLYAFIYAYTYQVGLKTYVDRGPITEVLVQNADAPEVNQNAITAIPVLANGATDNYDTASANLKVEIYRTVNGGEDFFFVASVNNGVTTYNDVLSDALLVANESLYTAGDVVENDPPPLCKTLCVTQSFAYYGDIKEGTEELTNVIRQSVALDFDAVPVDFECEVDDSIMELTSYNELPIALCQKYAYRIEGVFDELGRGGMFPVKISDVAGCVSRQSAVRTELGVFWFGIDGVYHSDGYQCTKVNKSLDKTYASFVSTTSKSSAPVKVQGRYDSKNKRVWWSVWESATNSDVDKCFVLDLNYGVSDDMPFTTCSGGASFSPTSLEFLGDIMYRADKRGYILKHTSTVFSDPKIDTTVAPSSWTVVPIIYDYISAGYNMGVDHIRKYSTRISCNVANETSVSMKLVSINDDGRKTADLAPIRFRNNIVWGDPDVYWGDPQIVWNKGGLLDSERKFPSGSLRYTYKQIEITNATVAILNSDLIGDATVAFLTSTTKTVTLDNAASYDWPTKSMDYYIAFESDGYTDEYLITVRADNVLTISDPSGSADFGSQSWVIRGIPKDETLNLLSYTIQYLPFSETQQQYYKALSGETGSGSLA